MDSMYARPILATLLDRLKERPTWIINIDGPRQSGKTTLIKQALRAIDRPSIYHSFDPPVSDQGQKRGEADPVLVEGKIPYEPRPDMLKLVGIWEQARLKAKESGSGYVLVLDEVHRIRDWSGVVKGLWDADRFVGLPMHVVVLGSAPMTMRADMSDALVGRFETIRITHWSFAEMHAAFGVDPERFIFFGGYPGAARLLHDEDRWREYVVNTIIGNTMDREVVALNRIDDPAILRRLLQVGSSKSGEIVSFNKLLGPMQGADNVKVLVWYLELLSRAGLLTGLGKYSTELLNIKRSSPKLQVLNTALMSVFSGLRFGDARTKRTYWGRLVESAVGAHLCNTAASGIRVGYWRHQGNEVDFVVSYGLRVLGIEVKASTQRRSTKGLAAFKSKYEHADTLTVGTGGMPLEEFFHKSAAELLDSK